MSVKVAHQMCVVLTSLSMLLKMGLFYMATRRHARGKRVFRHIWHQLRYFLPAFMAPKPRMLALEVEGRLVAVAWIHACCAGALFLVALVVVIMFPAITQFNSAYSSSSLSLSTLMFLKAMSIAFVFLSVFQKMNVRHCMGRFGCLLFQLPNAPRSNRERRENPALPLTPETLRNLLVAKSLDTLLSIWVWMGLVEQRSLNSYGPSYVVIVLYRLTLTVSLLCDILAVCLVITAAWLLAAYLAKHDPDQAFEDDYSSDSDDYASDSGSDSDSDDSEDSDDDDDSDDDSDERTDDDQSDYDGRSPKGRRSQSRSSRSSRKRNKKKKKRDADDPSTPLSEYESDDDDDDSDDEDDDYIFTVGGDMGGDRSRRRGKKKGRRGKRGGESSSNSPGRGSKPRVAGHHLVVRGALLVLGSAPSGALPCNGPCLHTDAYT